MTFRMEKGQRRKRNFRKLFHGTVGRLKPRGMATLDMYSAVKSVFIEKGTKLKLNVSIIRFKGKAGGGVGMGGGGGTFS